MTDWVQWHENYTDLNSSQSQRLGIVRKRIAEAFDRCSPGAIRIASMCAGDGRDILGVLQTHPRAKDVSGRLVELDSRLVERVRLSAPSEIEVVCGDAGTVMLMSVRPCKFAFMLRRIWQHHRDRYSKHN